MNRFYIVLLTGVAILFASVCFYIFSDLEKFDDGVEKRRVPLESRNVRASETESLSGPNFRSADVLDLAKTEATPRTLGFPPREGISLSKSDRLVNLANETQAGTRTLPVEQLIIHIQRLPTNEQFASIRVGIEEYLKTLNIQSVNVLFSLVPSVNRSDRRELAAMISGKYAERDLEATLEWVKKYCSSDTKEREFALSGIVYTLAKKRDAVLLTSVLPLIEDRFVRSTAIVSIVKGLQKEMESAKLQTLFDSLEGDELSLAKSLLEKR